MGYNYTFHAQREHFSARDELLIRNYIVYKNSSIAENDLRELHERDYNILSTDETAILHAAVLLQNGSNLSSVDGNREKVFVKRQDETNSVASSSISEAEISRIMEEARRRRSWMINTDLLD